MPARRLPASRSAKDPAYRSRPRLTLAAGATTTLYVARYDLPAARVRVVRLTPAERLVSWCRRRGVEGAIVGGFFVRPDGAALGELRTRGMLRRTLPFEAPWDATRACLHTQGGKVTIAPRDELPADPRGDLLQAGPLLVHGGVPVVEEGVDTEGFSAASQQFDSDITVGRYPRAALGLARRHLLAVACDGRADDEAGLTLREFAEALAALGAETALNLDGGGSTSLVCGGVLRNVPREEHGIPLAGGRPVTTALVLGA